MATAQPDPRAPFHLKLWGVRGSVPTTVPQNQAIGGNTPCMQIVTPSDELLIFDGGTGIRALGKEIVALATPPKAIHIFITHFHWDHIQGLPYFVPLFIPGQKVIFHSAHTPARLEQVLAAQMQSPYFPLEFHQLESSIEFRQTSAHPQHFGDLTVSSFPLNHPQGSVGFRIAHPDKVAIYATDHEHGVPEADLALRTISANADILVYDAQYLPSEYESRRGWGHSSWLEGTRAARDAGIKHLLLFHHDPDRDDDAVTAMIDEARAEFPGTLAAHESLIL